MRHRLYPLILPIGVALGASVAARAPGHAQAPTHQSACADSAEAARLAEELVEDFAGSDEDSIEFLQSAGLAPVDSGALIGAVTDTARCIAIASVLEPRLTRLSYAHRLVFARIGRYYVVAVLDTTPRPPGVVIEGRWLSFILDTADLTVLLENLLI